MSWSTVHPHVGRHGRTLRSQSTLGSEVSRVTTLWHLTHICSSTLLQLTSPSCGSYPLEHICNTCSTCQSRRLKAQMVSAHIWKRLLLDRKSENHVFDTLLLSLNNFAQTRQIQMDPRRGAGCPSTTSTQIAENVRIADLEPKWY